jgi:hypothetical protein
LIIAAILSLLLVLSWSINSVERLLAMELKLSHVASLRHAEFMAAETSLLACEQALSRREIGITEITEGESIEIEVVPGRVCEVLVLKHIAEKNIAPSKKSLMPKKIISSWVEVTTLPFEGPIHDGAQATAPTVPQTASPAKLSMMLQTTVLLKHGTAEIERHNWREIFIN